MEFDWHTAKSERNRAERGFGFDAAALIFEGPDRGNVRWIISARRASREERREWDAR
jgi:uncharacterized DUF497 family protein